MTNEEEEEAPHGMMIEVFKDADGDGNWVVHLDVCDHLTPGDVLLGLAAMRVAMIDIYETAQQALAQRN